MNTTATVTNDDLDDALGVGLPYETPFFLFSRQRIRTSVAKFNACFPGASIHYAMKANPHPDVLRTLAALGVGFEAASVYELQALTDLGISPTRIIYGTAVKPSCQIQDFARVGVDRFAFDSITELERIATAAPGSRVFARAAVDDTASVFKFSEKFGADVGDIVSLLQRAKTLGLHPYGVSFHVGSQTTDARAWGNAVKNILPILNDAHSKGIPIEMLNIGGGYPCKYRCGSIPTLEDIAQNTFEELRPVENPPLLILEPGRAIVADSGVLVTTIISRVKRKGRTWLFLDAGVYNALFEAMAYQGSTQYPVSSNRGVSSPTSLFALAGPTGDGPDVITREVSLPENIREGDRLVIEKVGAYTLAVLSAFNGFPQPRVYFV